MAIGIVVLILALVEDLVKSCQVLQECGDLDNLTYSIYIYICICTHDLMICNM